jgi:hypothetical protein
VRRSTGTVGLAGLTGARGRSRIRSSLTGAVVGEIVA